ncbi:c-type cytochrome [Ottowia caeni]|uniref:c-type cytochrome n=1 Tax=Ottowia caeni TaxID=2870339 RepID=UPI001E61F84B|nr:c-type cytochrome [Ottowia caeni]
MKRHPVLIPLICILSAALASPALAQLRAGQEVYKSVCVACHETGVAHAPKVGDTTAWKPLIEEGQHILSAHGYVGVRAMPAKGGDDKLSLEEFSRAVAWMARQAGGSWQDPDAAMMHRIRGEAVKRIDSDIRAKQKLKAVLRQQERK